MSDEHHDDLPLLTAEQVTGFLLSHPDFFDHHPQVLEGLQIPHPCGGAVSLIERQVYQLRTENRQLHQRLQELIDVARRNDDLARRLQVLMLALIEADDLDETLVRIQGVMRDEFQAEFTGLRLAAQPRQTTQTDGEFVAPADLTPFHALLPGRQATCGRLTQAQYRCLFSDPEGIASAAVVVLGGDDWWGVLGVGSGDSERFVPGMGTYFLLRIAELVSQALTPYLTALPSQRNS